ncbi:MAG: CBS domain-containing protein [bacterium]|nr:CBS domain-containing protein [bacterium]
MKVKEYMTKEVTTVSSSATFREVGEILYKNAFDILPVIDKKKELLGVVSKADLLHAVLPDYFDLLSDFSFVRDFGALEIDKDSIFMIERLLVVSDLMTKHVITIGEDDSLLKAIAVMNKNKVRVLPVVKGNKLIGIISRRDILRAFLTTD